MAACVVKGVQPLDNPTAFTNPFQFEITLECVSSLTDDLEWVLVYVGSAESAEHDQVLESVLVGPIQLGLFKFVFQTPAPDISKIPEDEVVGVTAILLTGKYQDQEFIRVGWYVSNEYTDPSYVAYKAEFDAEQKRRAEEEARQQSQGEGHGRNGDEYGPAEEDIMDVDEDEDDEDEDDAEDGDEDEEDEDVDADMSGVMDTSAPVTASPAVIDRLGGAGAGAGTGTSTTAQQKRSPNKPISPVRWPNFDPSLIRRQIQPVYFDEKTQTGFPRVTLFNIDWVREGHHQQ